MKAQKCTCAQCERGRRIGEITKGRSLPKMRALVTELYEDVLNMGMDLNIYRAVLDGSWPSAVEQLEQALTHAKMYAKSQQSGEIAEEETRG